MRNQPRYLYRRAMNDPNTARSPMSGFGGNSSLDYQGPVNTKGSYEVIGRAAPPQPPGCRTRGVFNPDPSYAIPRWAGGPDGVDGFGAVPALGNYTFKARTYPGFGAATTAGVAIQLTDAILARVQSLAVKPAKSADALKLETLCSKAPKPWPKNSWCTSYYAQQNNLAAALSGAAATAFTSALPTLKKKLTTEIEKLLADAPETARTKAGLKAYLASKVAYLDVCYSPGGDAEKALEVGAALLGGATGKKIPTKLCAISTVASVVGVNAKDIVSYAVDSAWSGIEAGITKVGQVDVPAGSLGYGTRCYKCHQECAGGIAVNLGQGLSKCSRKCSSTSPCPGGDVCQSGYCKPGEKSTSHFFQMVPTTQPVQTGFTMRVLDPSQNESTSDKVITTSKKTFPYLLAGGVVLALGTTLYLLRKK